jgi:hypothetical protein
MKKRNFNLEFSFPFFLFFSLIVSYFEEIKNISKKKTKNIKEITLWQSLDEGFTRERNKEENIININIQMTFDNLPSKKWRDFINLNITV